jgi:SAM-dependent methyltransferase
MDDDFSEASPWVRRFTSLIPASPWGLLPSVLDFACGSGRHARWLAAQGYRVEAVDQDAAALTKLVRVDGVTPTQADLERGPWPYHGRRFAGIVVTHYLHRPRLGDLLAALDDPGVLIYETFMAGNERFGKPSNPDFLLQSQELLAWAREGGLRVVAFEEGLVNRPKVAMMQRLCAVCGEAAEAYSPCL